MQPGQLIDHPEGGRYREVFRSSVRVDTQRGARDALTHIYFSLQPGEASRLHRVAADEVWNRYRGVVELLLWDEATATASVIELSEQSGHYCHVVPAGVWQAARARDEEALVGCSVGPGFSFDDFELVTAGSALATQVSAAGGAWAVE